MRASVEDEQEQVARAVIEDDGVVLHRGEAVALHAHGGELRIAHVVGVAQYVQQLLLADLHQRAAVAASGFDRREAGGYTNISKYVSSASASGSFN